MTTIPFELEALKNAHNYQRWSMEKVAPYLGKRILEVGAGIGNLSQHIPVRDLFVASEAEARLLAALQERIKARQSQMPATDAKKIEVRALDLSRPLVDSLKDYNFDTIVSFNVLEHIEDDAAAFRGMLELLRSSSAPGPKRIVTLVPAHPWALGPIDRTYGHFRRYTARSFREMATRAGADVRRDGGFESFYFNIVGLAGWFFYNRILKYKNVPEHSIKSVERLSPVMRLMDGLFSGVLRLPFGQSLIAVVEV